MSTVMFWQDSCVMGCVEAYRGFVLNAMRYFEMPLNGDRILNGVKIHESHFECVIITVRFVV